MQDQNRVVFPPDLAATIAAHRELFRGYTMSVAPAEGAPAGDTPPAAAPPAAAPPAAAPPAAAPPAEDVSSLPEWAQKLITTARDGEAKARTTAKATAAEEARNALIQELGKALGLVKGEEKLDPAQLQAQLAEQQADGSLTKVQLEAMKIAVKPETGVNALALLDSNSFLTAIKGLAPTDAAGIAAAIKAAVEANPMLKAAPGGPSRSGGEFSGGTGEKPKNNLGLKGALDAFYAPKS